MDNKLLQLSDLLLEGTRAALNEIYRKVSNENSFSRMKIKLGLWRNFLEKEADHEVNKFIIKVNLSEYDHISYKEKEVAKVGHEKQVRDLVTSYNRKIISVIMNSINQKMLSSETPVIKFNQRKSFLSTRFAPH